MNEQVLFQNFLQKKLIELQAKNPSYSLRAFSQKVGLASGPMTEILKGQRRVSRKVAEKIVTNLALDPSERAELLKNFPEKLRRNSKISPDRNQYLVETMKLSSEQFQAISNWLHLAILSLMRTRSFKSDVSWMAKRFKVSEDEVWQALMRMSRLGMIRKNEQGEWERNARKFNTTDDVMDLSIQKSHLNDLEMAKEKLIKVSVAHRDFSSFTFPANPELLPKAKEILRKAQDDLAELMGEDNPNDVYRVCMYLYPLTEIELNKEIK
ncbi:MAG: DUF4423 domain-containing protein [Bacteriovoracaceae bacterium]